MASTRVIIHIKEKESADVGKRVRAVGMVFYKRGDLTVGKVYELRRNTDNRFDQNCLEIMENGEVIGTINKNLAALLRSIPIVNGRW